MADKIQNNPLVTVSVITYNSSATVLDTLDSIAKQTYDNLQLVVSDDGSRDNTVSLCEEWIGQHENRFVNTTLLTVEKNTGVAANCNRAINHIHGEFSKIIAGDDLLMEDCVEKCVNYFHANPEAEVLFSNCYLFTEREKRKVIGTMPTQDGKDMLALSIKQQKIVLYYALFIPTPTIFLKSSVFNRYKYDERYPGCEDYPFVLNLVENNIKLYYMDEFTVYYRISDSVSHPSSILENGRMWYSHRKFFDEQLYGKLIYDHPRIFNYKMARFMLADFRMYVLGNKNTKLNHLFSFIYRIMLGKKLNMNERDAVEYARNYSK